MPLRKDYDEFLKKRALTESRELAALWPMQEHRYVKPFRIFGNLYYVGDSWIGMHLVDTGDGLLLFDGGNCGRGATAMLIQAIWEMGFRPNDVKWMILSHGHVDHIGAAVFFRNMFGTKLFLGAPDAADFRLHPERSLIQESTDCMDELFAPDVEIHDGDILTFGATRIRFALVPGHTPGTIACFFDVTDSGETKKAGYYGGFGYNTLQKEYLLDIGDTSFSMRQTYLNSIRKVIDEPVDIFMPNHTDSVDVVALRREMELHPEKNPFINRTVWKEFLQKKYDGAAAIMADPLQN